MTVDRKLVCHEVKNQDGKHYGWMIWCPGCKETHILDGRWQFNGDQMKPTFKPSLLQSGIKNKEGKIVLPRCHSFITNGRMQFLGDCEHDLKNQTVDLEPFDERL